MFTLHNRTVNRNSIFFKNTYYLISSNMLKATYFLPTNEHNYLIIPSKSLTVKDLHTAQDSRRMHNVTRYRDYVRRSSILEKLFLLEQISKNATSFIKYSTILKTLRPYAVICSLFCVKSTQLIHKRALTNAKRNI